MTIFIQTQKQKQLSIKGTFINKGDILRFINQSILQL